MGYDQALSRMERDQQLLNLVEHHFTVCEARDVVCKHVIRRPDISHVVLSGHLPDAGGGLRFGLVRTWIS